MMKSFLRNKDNKEESLQETFSFPDLISIYLETAQMRRRQELKHLSSSTNRKSFFSVHCSLLILKIVW